MSEEPYRCFAVRREDGVARVTVDHPPINLMDAAMMKELARLARELTADDSVRVVVVDSANPEFFIAHADVRRLQSYPVEQPSRPERLNGLHRVYEEWRTMPKATIAQIEGYARGGGSEFALALDMRFAAIGKAVLSQPETALGILPGGTGSQRLPTLVGRGRALEIILGADDFDAETAERYGWVNRALAPAEIGPFVDRLAARIASFPPHAIVKSKQAVDAALPDPRAGLLTETLLWEETFVHPAAKRRMDRFFEIGGQTIERERDWDGLVCDLAAAEAS